jgi:hypothetical protein
MKFVGVFIAFRAAAEDRHERFFHNNCPMCFRNGSQEVASSMVVKRKSTTSEMPILANSFAASKHL